MTRQQILTNFYLSPEVNECINKQDPEHLRDDLKSELFAVLCELDEPFLIGLHQRKELKFYAVRIILNMIQSNTSPFYKKFRTINSSYDDITEKASRYQTVSDIAPESDIQVRFAGNVVNSQIQQYHPEDEKEMLEYERLFDTRVKEVEAILNTFHWYTAELFRCYVKHGSIRKVSEEIGIPPTSVFNTIKKVRAKILELCSK
jgi:hypothetical protein